MKTTERGELCIGLSDGYSAQKHITARSGVESPAKPAPTIATVGLVELARSSVIVYLSFMRRIGEFISELPDDHLVGWKSKRWQFS